MTERGYSPEYLMALDYISFKLLVDASERINAEEIVADFWLSAEAAQGSGKSMKEAVKPYMERAGMKTKGVSSGKKDAAAFNSKYPRGI